MRVQIRLLTAVAAVLSLGALTTSIAHAQTPPLGGDCPSSHTRTGPNGELTDDGKSYNETWVSTSWQTVYDRPVDPCPTDPCATAPEKKYSYNIAGKTTKVVATQSADFKFNLWDVFLRLIGLPREKDKWQTQNETEEVSAGINKPDTPASCNTKYICDLILTTTRYKEARINTQEAGFREKTNHAYTARPAEWNVKSYTYDHCTGQYIPLPPPPPNCPPPSGGSGSTIASASTEISCTIEPCIETAL